MSPDPQQFIKYPKEVLGWRRRVSASQWTVLTVLLDKTAGWDKESDAVSISQIQAETTMGRTSIYEALAAMELPDGPLVVTGRAARDIPIYRIRPCTRPESGMVSNTTRPESGQVDTPTRPESGHTTDVNTAHL